MVVPMIRALALLLLAAMWRGLAANYHNITHPSLPNYLAATSGLSLASLIPFTSDCPPAGECTTDAPSIFAQGESWKAYEESMPSVCPSWVKPPSTRRW
jgi:hypothetical protein